MIEHANIKIDGVTFDLVLLSQRAGTTIGVRIDNADEEHVYMSPRAATALGLILQEMGCEAEE